MAGYLWEVACPLNANLSDLSSVGDIHDSFCSHEKRSALPYNASAQKAAYKIQETYEFRTTGAYSTSSLSAPQAQDMCGEISSSYRPRRRFLRECAPLRP